LSNLAGGVVGLIAGAVAVGAWQLLRRLKSKPKALHQQRTNLVPVALAFSVAQTFGS